MSRIDPGRIRWRLLAANLAVAVAAVVAVAAGVWLAAPRAFEDAMGHATDGATGGGMMDRGGMIGSGGMMDPLIRAAFGDALGSALVLGLVAAGAVAAIAAVVVSDRISRPVTDLAAASRRIARGEYDQRVPRASGELGDLAESFNTMAATLAATEQRRRDLIGDVAHELRTPIASVRGYVEGLEAGVFEPGPETWRILDEQTGRLERLVDDLALLWQAESSDLRIELQPLDGPTALAEAVERHRASAVGRGIELAVGQVAPGGILADRMRLAQILDNLVANALRYTSRGGHVALALAFDGPRAVISVRDDGPGLTSDQAAHVFDRFYRGDPSRSREAGGSGLGLAISRSLVEAMGGDIAVTSPGAGLGAVFTVRLRRA